MMLKMESQQVFLKEVFNMDTEEFIKTAAKFRGLQAGASFAEGFIYQKRFPVGLTKRVLP